MSKKARAISEEAPRTSFIPEAPPAPPPHETAVPTETPKADATKQMIAPVTLKISKADDRMIEITLTVPPLSPCIERKFLPLSYSPEELASITADAIQRAASSAKTDGIHQHARREQQEAEARNRYQNK